MCEGVVPVKPQQTTKETTMSEETYEPRREQEQEQAAELARFTAFQQGGALVAAGPGEQRHLAGVTVRSLLFGL